MMVEVANGFMKNFLVVRGRGSVRRGGRERRDVKTGRGARGWVLIVNPARIRVIQAIPPPVRMNHDLFF